MPNFILRKSDKQICVVWSNNGTTFDVIPPSHYEAPHGTYDSEAFIVEEVLLEDVLCMSQDYYVVLSYQEECKRIQDTLIGE